MVNKFGSISYLRYNLDKFERILQVSEKDITLVLTKREKVGKGLGQMRRDGQVPAVIHNPGKDSISVSGSFIDVTKVYQQAGRHHPIDLQVDGDKYFTIIKDVDFEPTKHSIRHVVFGIIKQNEIVETEVSVELIGDAPAGKIGLIIDKLTYHLNVEAFPRDLPDKLEVSIEGLAEVGDKVTVADIILQKGVKILAEPEHVIAQVEEPHIQAVEEPEAEVLESETPSEQVAESNVGSEEVN